MRGPTQREELVRFVYRRHVKSVYGFFACSVPHATAEDLTSMTFERVLRFWATYRPERASERTWILAIARNLLTDHFRREKRRPAISTDEVPALLESLHGTDEPVQRALDVHELRAYLASLSDRQREVIALRYVADLPASEIGAILGLTSANVHQILSRSLKQLRAQVEAADLQAEAYGHGAADAAGGRAP